MVVKLDEVKSALSFLEILRGRNSVFFSPQIGDTNILVEENWRYNCLKHGIY